MKGNSGKSTLSVVGLVVDVCSSPPPNVANQADPLRETEQ